MEMRVIIRLSMRGDQNGEIKRLKRVGLRRRLKRKLERCGGERAKNRYEEGKRDISDGIQSVSSTSMRQRSGFY